MGQQGERRTIKVAVYIVAEVDVDAYNAEYGTALTPREVAKDVRDSMYSAATTAAFPQESNDRIITSAVLGN